LVEARKVKAAQGGTLTAAGVASDVLGYAASELAPQLQKAKRAVEQAKSEAAERRATLVLKQSDKTNAAGQMRRLWKLDKLTPCTWLKLIKPSSVMAEMFQTGDSKAAPSR
jgi:hypothetical protein